MRYIQKWRICGNLLPILCLVPCLLQAGLATDSLDAEAASLETGATVSVIFGEPSSTGALNRFRLTKSLHDLLL